MSNASTQKFHELNELLANARDDLFQGALVGTAIGTGATYLTQRNRNCVGTVSSAITGGVIAHGISKMTNQDIYMSGLHQTPQSAMIITTALTTLASGALMNAIFGQDKD